MGVLGRLVGRLRGGSLSAPAETVEAEAPGADEPPAALRLIGAEIDRALDANAERNRSIETRAVGLIAATALGVALLQLQDRDWLMACAIATNLAAGAMGGWALLPQYRHTLNLVEIAKTARWMTGEDAAQYLALKKINLSRLNSGAIDRRFRRLRIGVILLLAAMAFTLLSSVGLAAPIVEGLSVLFAALSDALNTHLEWLNERQDDGTR